MWCAPNFLSLVGLSAMVVCYALTYSYSPDFTQPLPRWLYAYSALTLFAYQTIDVRQLTHALPHLTHQPSAHLCLSLLCCMLLQNLDGRQARRTGNSSPLGLLFDHGVDALNCTFASLLLATVYQIGLLGPLPLFLFWNIGFVPFVFATWEEYFTGKLTLGQVNGPSDGMFMCQLFCMAGFCIPGIYTTSYAAMFPFLASTPVANLTIGTFPLLLGWVGIPATVLGNIYQVVKKRSLFPQPASYLLPFLCMGLIGWVWVWLQPDFFLLHTRAYCFSLGFLFCQMICSLMVAHICDEEYRLARPALLPLIAAFTNCVVLPHLLNQSPLIDPELTIYILLATNFALWFHFVFNSMLGA